MLLDPGIATAAFVALALFLLAGTLLAAGRRGPEAVILAAFLGMVGANFLATALSLAAEGGQSVRWQRLAFAALALDPPLLLLFVSGYPYQRRGRGVRAVLGVVAALAAASVVFAVTSERIVETRTLEHAVVIGELALAYLAAWVLAARAVVEAPTPQLARRAGWLVAAVGVAVVPRLGGLPSDFSSGVPAAEVALGAPIAAAALAGGWWLARPGFRAHPEVRGTFRFLVLVVVAVLGLTFALDLAPGGPFRGTVFYASRWVVFAFILVYGILAYEVLPFGRRVGRTVPIVAGVLGGGAAALATAVALADQPDAFAVPLSAAVGLAASVPAAMLARGASRSLEAVFGASGQSERGLELYRAALEAAWAAGLPSPASRARLEQDRRAFGVSADEARALGHVVARSLGGAARPLAPGDEPVPGLVLGQLLGEGAHGRVFEARRYPSGARVVVKEFRADRLEPEVSRRRILEELRPLQALQDPRIVRLLDVHTPPGRHLLVMEHVEGRSLAARLEDGPLPETAIRTMLADVLGALGAAHAAGVVHRDVKPSNILVRPDGRARLTDFGLARMQSAEEQPSGGTVSKLDALGGFAGTLAYMAPEQARGGRVGPAADLYAAGLVAYEALTGRPALDLRGFTAYDALEKVAHPAIDLAAVPETWRPFLARALAPSAAERHASAATMAAALPATPRR